MTRTSLDRLTAAKLYVLVDGRALLAEFRRLIENLVSAHVDVLQLRDKQFPDRRALDEPVSCVKSTRGQRRFSS